MKFTFTTKKKYTYEVLKVAGGVKVRFYEIVESEPPVIQDIENKELLNKHFVYSSKDNIGTLVVSKSKIESLSEKCKIEISEDRKMKNVLYI